MIKKFKNKQYILFLLLLLIFHFTANLVWIKLNKNPLDFDPVGHTLISINTAEYIKTHILDFSLKDYMRISPAYPNFTHTASLFFIFLFGNNWKAIAFTSTLFFLLAILAVFLYAREISYSNKIAFFSAFFYSFFVSIVQYSRLFILDIPLTAMVFLTLFFWERFKKKESYRFLYASAFTFAFAQLSKWNAIVFLLIPAGSLLYSLYKQKRFFKRSFLVPLGLFIAIVVLLVTPWYFYNFSEFLRLGKINYLGEADDPKNLLTFNNLFFYLKLIIIFQIHFIGFILFAISLVIVLIKRKKSYLATPLSTLIFCYLFFTFFIINKNIRVIFVLMPFVALALAEGADYLWDRLFSRIFVLAVAFYMVIAFFILSFGFPVAPNFKYVKKLPLLGWTDLVYLDTYPVNLLISEPAILYNKIADTILAQKTKAPRLKVLVSLHQPYFHKDHFILQLYMQERSVSYANKLLRTKIELLDARQALNKSQSLAGALDNIDIILTAKKNPIHPEQRLDPFYKPIMTVQRFLLRRNSGFTKKSEFDLPEQDKVILYINQYTNR